MQERFCIVIPSAARQGAQYLEETLRDITTKLGPEAARIESLIVYNPSGGSDRPHSGFTAAQQALARGDYGELGAKIKLLTPADLPPPLQDRHRSTRAPRTVRQCNDFAHALAFARDTTADFLLLFEDDVRLTNGFLDKALEVVRDADRRGLRPLFLSLFSPHWGPAGAFYPFFGYSQAVLFRSGADVEAARESLACDASEVLADHNLMHLRVDGRRGYVRYPSLAQHVGLVSAATPDLSRRLIAPTFYEGAEKPMAFDLRCRLMWIASSARRRLFPDKE